MSTTEKIRELAKKFQDGVPMGFESLALLKDAACMAELLETAENIIRADDPTTNWLADFQKFQDGKNG